MQLQEAINKINLRVDQLDLVSARKLLEDNIEFLKGKKHLLNSNARALLEFLLSADIPPITRKELLVIQAINSLATKFDIVSLKIMLKNNPDILLREEVIQYLNSDAKVLLEGMAVISKDQININL